MSIKRIKKPISQKLEELLKSTKLTEQQKKLWGEYLSFLNIEQIKDLCEIIEKDEETFNDLTKELESKVL